MKIIADGGSTKTNWCLVSKEGKKIYFNTEGYNPYFISTEGIIASLHNNLPDNLELDQITEVNYYGAGCSNEDKREIVQQAMQAVFTKAHVFIGHDLLAAARALLGNNRGFAAILGTGTNSCIYDGTGIETCIDSLAYFLGDEGSGSYIGKRVLRDYFRGYMPAGLADSFWDTYQLTVEDVLDRLYNQPHPNRFLAQFSKFLYDNNNYLPYTRDVVCEGFDAFFKNLVIHYPNYKDYTFNCIGSVGYNFRDVLEEVATKYGMATGKIIRSPIDDLVFFHMNLATQN